MDHSHQMGSIEMEEERERVRERTRARGGSAALVDQEREANNMNLCCLLFILKEARLFCTSCLAPQ
jgi:hypothetical protein